MQFLVLKLLKISLKTQGINPGDSLTPNSV